MFVRARVCVLVCSFVIYSTCCCVVYCVVLLCVRLSPPSSFGGMRLSPSPCYRVR